MADIAKKKKSGYCQSKAHNAYCFCPFEKCNSTNEKAAWDHGRNTCKEELSLLPCVFIDSIFIYGLMEMYLMLWVKI